MKFEDLTPEEQQKLDKSFFETFDPETFEFRSLQRRRAGGVMPRRYCYVGPSELKERLKRGSHCIQIVDVVRNLIPWTTAFLPPERVKGSVPATFIIDTAERLWVADRRSEHVACANGGEVLAAGEMVFERTGDRVEVVEVTNQSTGYCPESDCWSAIARVLDRLRIVHPPSLTAAFVFRRCDRCSVINLVKDDVFECAVCKSPLSQHWNFPPSLTYFP